MFRLYERVDHLPYPAGAVEWLDVVGVRELAVNGAFYLLQKSPMS